MATAKKCKDCGAKLSGATCAACAKGKAKPTKGGKPPFGKKK